VAVAVVALVAQQATAVAAVVAVEGPAAAPDRQEPQTRAAAVAVAAVPRQRAALAAQVS